MFAGLPVDELGAIADVMREQHANAGEVLLTHGRRGDQVLIVLEGVVEVQRNGEVLEVMGRGAVVGEVAVFTDHHRNATVIARTDVQLGLIDGPALRSLADAIPLLSERLGSVVQIRRIQ
jgi:CRP-like cAMP-binding protein